MANETRGHIRWTLDEALAIGANALQFLDKGKGIVEATFEAQKLALPPYRWRDLPELKKLEAHTKVSGGLMRYADRARVLPTEELTALQVAAPKASKKLPIRAPVEPVKGDAAITPTGRVKWSLLQECRVSRAIQTFRSTMPKGSSLTALVMRAQEMVLPPEFRKTRSSLTNLDYRGDLATMLARGLSAAPEFATWELEGKPAPAPPPPPPMPLETEPEARQAVDAPAPIASPAVASDRIRFLDLDVKPWPDFADRPRNIVWTTLEKAKFTVLWDRVDMEGVARSKAGYVVQMHCGIAPDRWRPRRSFIDLVAGKYLDTLLEEGRNNAWLIKPAEPPAPPAPIPPPVDVAAPMAASFNETLQEPAAPVAAPIPLPAPSASLAEAAAAFGATVQAGLHLLLEAHAHHVLRAFDAKVSSIAHEVGQSLAKQIANSIEFSLKQTVLDTMAAELGGPVKPPAPIQEASRSFPERPKEDPPPAINAEQHAQARALLSPPPLNDWQARQAAALLAAVKPDPEVPACQDMETFAVKKLKVDVVGFTDGSHNAQIRAAFNGHTDLAFYTADDKNRFKPHKGRHVVMLIDRIPHSLREKLQSAKVKPILVKGTVYNVIHAIEELHRSKGIPL